jgi:hypothetical protein
MYVPFSVFCTLFVCVCVRERERERERESVCVCVLYYCHRVSTQLQLNIYVISYHCTTKPIGNSITNYVGDPEFEIEINTFKNASPENW